MAQNPSKGLIRPTLRSGKILSVHKVAPKHFRFFFENIPIFQKS